MAQAAKTKLASVPPAPKPEPAPKAAPKAKVMAPPSGQIPLDVTPVQLARSIDRHRHVLAHMVADPDQHVGDAGIAAVGSALDVLVRVKPMRGDKR